MCDGISVATELMVSVADLKVAHRSISGRQGGGYREQRHWHSSIPFPSPSMEQHYGIGAGGARDGAGDGAGDGAPGHCVCW